MSTRCYIGKVNGDGTVRAIYNHFDGYPEGVGSVLIAHYTDEYRIDRLLDLGDMSTIGEEPIGTWDDRVYDYTKCRTYRERGEENCDAKIYKDESEFLEKCEEDYTYLYKDSEWLVRYLSNELKPLAKILKKY